MSLLVSFTVSVSAGDIGHINIEAEDIRDRINERIAARIEQRVRHQASARVRQQVEDSIQESIAGTVNDAVLPSAGSSLPARVESVPTETTVDIAPAARLITGDLEAIVDIDRVLESQLSRIEQEIDLVVDTVKDREGNAALRNEWLVMTDETALKKLEAAGYRINHVEALGGLGFIMGTISAPDTFNPQEIASVQVLNDPQVVVDLNHVYLPQRDDELPGNTPASQRTGTDTNAAWARVGMIDSSIDQAHEVFAGSRISEASFTPRGFNRTSQHGTAIASILIGQSALFRGLSPASKLYNGVVFANDRMGREFSTTAAIVRAINWLIENEVRLINMSLAGPDNAILAKAITSACERGTTLVTAVGNAGPSAPPLYPAAYDCTIAVTAVDRDGTPYHRANRGAHVDFALPGVDIRHAIADGALGQSSGTSYAAAILSGLISSSLPEDQAGAGAIKDQLQSLSTDAGLKGADRIFGQGIIRLPATAHISY